MRKIVLSLLLLLFLGTTACQAATETPPTATPLPQPTATPEPPTATPPPPTPTEATSSGDTNAAPATSGDIFASDDTSCRPESIEQLVRLPKIDGVDVKLETDWAYNGQEEGEFTLVEYSDFQCPACQQAAPALEALKTEMGDQMRFVFRHNPLTSIHPLAVLSAEATEAAAAQGGADAFFAMHDILFENQAEWSNLNREQAIETFVGYAEELGLDAEQVAADLEAGTFTEQIREAESQARQLNINSTPSLFINGYPFPLQDVPLSPEGINFFLDIIRLIERQYTPPPQVIDFDRSYQATVVTEEGEILIDLYTDTAPVNVNSFVYLAEQGWYDQTSFHRVLPGFMAQGGDPSGTGMGWPGYRCDDEVNDSLSFDRPGLVAFANSGSNTNGGQFFITYGPAQHLDAGFTIIGEVVSGQEYVDALTPRDPEQNPDFVGDAIVRVEIEEQ